jgi:glycosyltransferase involved in cell wall biosynthesis
MLLIHAFEKVANKISTAKLLMCGEGPLRESIKKEIMKRGLGDRVTMLGYLSPLLLEELRSKAGIYVLPSRSEGLSLALLEAMAAGKTVIASRNESHMAILQHGENSLLFDLDDADDLAGQLLLAIGDEVLRSRLSQSARYLCESEFSNRKAAAKLEDLYSQAISTSRVR